LLVNNSCAGSPCLGYIFALPLWVNLSCSNTHPLVLYIHPLSGKYLTLTTLPLGVSHFPVKHPILHHHPTAGRPCFAKPRKLATQLSVRVKAELDKLLQQGII